jgi:ATP-dependent Clp protease adaptor protein ClpS
MEASVRIQFPPQAGFFLLYNYNIMTAPALPDIKIIPNEETELEPLFRVLIHNDAVTPMDFVVNVLQRIFMLGMDRATDIMFTAHIQGLAYVQTLPKSEADKRISPQGWMAIHFIFQRSQNEI